MRLNDIVHFAIDALKGYHSRTLLMLLAMAIGVASVILLTSLGEGARRYVVDQFASLGTNLLIVLPGRSETTGGMPPMVSDTPRDITLDDAMALKRSRYINKVAPIVVGSAPVSWQMVEREVTIMGSTRTMFAVRHVGVFKGDVLPVNEENRSVPVCVLGYTLYKELFRSVSPLGKWVRVNEYRCRVIGVLDEEGMSMGVDMGDVLIMPVQSAMNLFNTNTMFRVLAEARDKSVIEKAKKDIERIIQLRHDGENDVTVISQDSILSTFDRILSALTYALGGIAVVSLVVAGIMIMNVMLVAVAQRSSEIGLLKALGAPEQQIRVLFLTESAFLSFVGALLGLGIGLLINHFVRAYYPDFPFYAPRWAIVMSIIMALSTGIIFGWLPARQAAQLDPVESLSKH